MEGGRKQFFCNNNEIYSRYIWLFVLYGCGTRWHLDSGIKYYMGVKIATPIGKIFCKTKCLTFLLFKQNNANFCFPNKWLSHWAIGGISHFCWHLVALAGITLCVQIWNCLLWFDSSRSVRPFYCYNRAEVGKFTIQDSTCHASI